MRCFSLPLSGERYVTVRMRARADPPQQGLSNLSAAGGGSPWPGAPRSRGLAPRRSFPLDRGPRSWLQVPAERTEDRVLDRGPSLRVDRIHDRVLPALRVAALGEADHQAAFGRSPHGQPVQLQRVADDAADVGDQAELAIGGRRGGEDDAADTKRIGRWTA